MKTLELSFGKTLRVFGKTLRVIVNLSTRRREQRGAKLCTPESQRSRSDRFLETTLPNRRRNPITSLSPPCFCVDDE